MKRFFEENWKWLVALALVFVSAVLIRVYHLTLLPVFADEAIYVRWSQIMSAEPTLRFLPLSDGKQPLFMWILMFYVRRLSDPLFSGRILSVVSGIGTMIGVLAVSYLLFKNKLVSLVSIFIYSFSPFSFFFDRMALVDSLLAAFSVWAMFFGILTSKYKRLDMAMLTGFMLGGALLTKSPAIFITLLLPTSWIFVDWQKDIKKNIYQLLKLISLMLTTYIIAYGLYNILRLGPNFNLISSRNQDYLFPISHLWINPKDPFIFHIEEIFKDWFIKMGPWPILMLTAIGLLTTAKKYCKESVFLLFWFLFPILVESMYAKVFTVRYILYTLPPVFILAASAFLEDRVKMLKSFLWILIILFTGFSAYFDYQLLVNPDRANLPSSERSGYLEEWTSGQGIKEISEYIRSEYTKNPNKKIIVGTEGYFGTLPDGLQMYLNNLPQVTVIGVGLNFQEVPRSLVESQLAGNSTYLVVNQSRFNSTADKLGFELIASYLKALRREKESHEYLRFGPQESLLFYKLTSKSVVLSINK